MARAPFSRADIAAFKQEVENAKYALFAAREELTSARENLKARKKSLADARYFNAQVRKDPQP